MAGTTNIPKRSKLKDLTGQRFGRLVVIERAKSNLSRHHRWVCRCDCGIVTAPTTQSLVIGHSKSCGCLRKERMTKHGKRQTAEWRSWRYMRVRCYLVSRDTFKHYGGRGITVCDRWLNGESGQGPFECFLADMGLMPSPKHTLDRIDNDKNYTPDNCQWATRSQQVRNRRKTKRVIFNGELVVAADLAERFSINPNLFVRRLYKGWPIERALIQNPPRRRRCS